MSRSADELFSPNPMPPRSVCALPEPCEFEQGGLMKEYGF